MVNRIGRTVGFTLIEMAVVLVVIGLVLSGGLVAVAPILQNSKVSETAGRIDRIEQALILYVIRYGCLPCPAANVNSSVIANNPGQAIDDAVYPTGCANAACAAGTGQGIVPWVNLGLSEADITDGFGYRIDYAVVPALTLTNGMVRTPPATYPVGNIAVNTSDAVPITTVAAYALVSHGPDRSRGFAAETGVQAADPNASANQTANGDNSNATPFVQNDLIDVNGANHFDDIVRWRTAPIVIQLCGSNACGNPA